MTDFIDAKEQLKILKRGAVHIEVEEDLLKKLAQSKEKKIPLRIKAGFDPTAPDLHLGHTVLLTKMRQFQELGHQVIFLIGDFTSRIGDPSGRNTTRPPLTDDEIIANASTYKRQVFKILDEKKTIIEYNSKWLAPFTFDDVIKLASKYSVARMIEREDFKTRLESGKPISMHELLYPLVQGYDSVALKADVELGGSDQLFNLLVGRDLMRHFNLEPQCILTVPLLEGLEAREENGKIVGAKMSKSYNNYVGVEEDANTQFGKLMSICDALMWRYYDLLSFKSSEEIENLKTIHPKDAKIQLAMELVTRFHGPEKAQEAKAQFDSLFGSANRHEIPVDAPSFKFAAKDGYLLLNALVESELVPSNSEAKRLLRQGAVSVDGERIEDIAFVLPQGSHTLRAGKKRWARVIIE
ncbi:MAG: tyrosine--tRNA ligase [Myxococcales bacterium]|nr:tyrosine--tRNA ligase [Myxococcales bacterium]USN51000.1 MAG: tyrosine--tRNA ligase [Myxococcales bacterium]